MDKRFASCVICGLVFLTVVEPAVISFVSRDFKENIPHMLVNLPAILPHAPEHPHINHHGAHTHQENRSPSPLRNTYTTISGGTISKKTNFTVDGIVKESHDVTYTIDGLIVDSHVNAGTIRA